MCDWLGLCKQSEKDHLLAVTADAYMAERTHTTKKKLTLARMSQVETRERENENERAREINSKKH